MFESFVSNATFGAFAKTGSYTPPGVGAEPVEIRVILDLAIEAYDQYGQLVIDYDSADFQSEKNAILRKGGVLTVAGYDGLHWRLLSRRKDDGFICTWAIERFTPPEEEENGEAT